MFCIRCGSQLGEGSVFCPRCGVRVAPIVEQAAAVAAPPQATIDVSPKSRLATSLLAWFLGEFGAHRFYTGKIGTAVVMLVLGGVSSLSICGTIFRARFLSGGGPGWGILLIGGLLYFAVWVWSIIDFIMAVTGNFKDSVGKPITRW